MSMKDPESAQYTPRRGPQWSQPPPHGHGAWRAQDMQTCHSVPRRLESMVHRQIAKSQQRPAQEGWGPWTRVRGH